jgi:hypothetical protein
MPFDELTNVIDRLITLFDRMLLTKELPPASTPDGFPTAIGYKSPGEKKLEWRSRGRHECVAAGTRPSDPCLRVTRRLVAVS